MTHKVLKIIFILFVIFSFCISYVFATDINLNLPGTTNNNSENTSISNQEEENQNSANINAQNQAVQNSESVENVDNNQNNEIVDDDASTLGDQESETLQPMDVSTAPENGLGITNIINILLITVGVILILLAIAIIIRLKK